MSNYNNIESKLEQIEIDIVTEEWEIRQLRYRLNNLEGSVQIRKGMKNIIERRVSEIKSAASPDGLLNIDGQTDKDFADGNIDTECKNLLCDCALDEIDIRFPAPTLKYIAA
jgi:hypothetical protein